MNTEFIDSFGEKIELSLKHESSKLVYYALPEKMISLGNNRGIFVLAGYVII